MHTHPPHTACAYTLHVPAPLQDGDTALLRACLHGYPATVELLLAHGASTSIVNKKGKNAMALVREDAVKKRPNYQRCEQLLQEVCSVHIFGSGNVCVYYQSPQLSVMRAAAGGVCVCACVCVVFWGGQGEYFQHCPQLLQWCARVWCLGSSRAGGGTQEAEVSIGTQLAAL